MLDPRAQPTNSHVPAFDPTGVINDRYARVVRKTVQNYDNFRNRQEAGEVHFVPGEESTGVFSPPLWKTSSSPSSSPGHVHVNYRHLSPASRSQAIARGQWELMEMVKNMPETSYELSLRDIVEQPARPPEPREQEQCLIREREKQKPAPKMVRSESIENRGLFLKMIFPFFSLDSQKKKKKKKTKKKKMAAPASGPTCAKVSPKPEASDRSANRGSDKDWWKKSGRFSGNSGSSGSSSNGSRHSNPGRSSGCWPIFFSRNRRPAE